MKLTSEVLTDALGYIDDDMLAAAAELRMKQQKKPEKISRKKLLAIGAPLAAACLCLTMLPGFVTHLYKCDSSAQNSARTEDIYFNAKETDAAPESASDYSNDLLQTSFEALILEVHPDSLLVEPGEDTAERLSSGKILVSLEGLSREELPELAAGQRILIFYDGQIAESFPAQITTVIAIRDL